MDSVAENWRDIIAVVALAVSFLGFSIAIWQILRTRRAAEAAEQAASAARKSLAQYLSIVDLVRASERIEEIKGLHRRQEWQQALYKYHDIRLMLSDIRARHPVLTREQRQLMQQAVDQFVTIERAVARALSAGGQPSNPNRYEGFLLDAQSLSDGLASQLKQSV